MSGDAPIRFAVVGHRFGEFHVRTLAAMPGVKLVAVADRSSDTLDAVSVCISPKARRDLLATAVERGLALFIEKPWASDARQARELAEIVRPSRGLPLYRDRGSLAMSKVSVQHCSRWQRMRKVLGPSVPKSRIAEWLPAERRVSRVVIVELAQGLPVDRVVALIRTLLHVAFSRWHVERSFQDEKDQLGLDQFECRRYVVDPSGVTCPK